MFTSSESISRASTRMFLSVGVHALLIPLALALRTSRPNHPSPTIGHVVLVAPRIKPRPVVTHSAPAAASTRASSMKTFSAKTFAAPASVLVKRPPSVITLPDAEIPLPAPPASVEPSILTTLPSAPIIVGKLSTAAVMSEPARPGGPAYGAGFPSGTRVEPAPQHALIARAGFGDASVKAAAAPSSSAHHLPTKTVEILSKPRPAYTDEARRLRIEGEVILEILFTAAGEPRVLRVVQGLGHGLDASAVESAAHIGYRPATRAGEPVDQTATVHIVFQLAY